MRGEEGQVTLSMPEFNIIAAVAYREFGLKIIPEKMMMVQSRLRHRLRALNLPDFDAYSRMLDTPQGIDERRFFVSALTTNVSHFHREPHHFDLLVKALAPELKQRIQAKERIRIWSAGCSNGQEPYSIAMRLLQVEPNLTQTDFRILATDIDPKVISFATEGAYGSRLLSGVPDKDRRRFFKEKPNHSIVSDELRKCVTFRELNLLATWPMRHQFDAIFCRNVVIYFDVETQEKLWPRFNASLAKRGVFFLGHSERIALPGKCGFKSIGPTAYEKCVAATGIPSTKIRGQNGTS
ncbi:CheR family methyltransferase [Tateyamaria sp.]|uniref:CheR family methyltransferase n=1 Tax=Tateyamaria sp. TaxID=1929288 RepID=UPI00329F5636